jgi:hypothetical protein
MKTGPGRGLQRTQGPNPRREKAAIVERAGTGPRNDCTVGQDEHRVLQAGIVFLDAGQEGRAPRALPDSHWFLIGPLALAQ